MKRKAITRYLKPYNIYQSRRTTIANAFASALAPCDQYDDTLVSEAMAALGQDPDANLACFYCGMAAETWDHIHALVKVGEYAGWGHTLGNLVPCCKLCNSRKGGTDVSKFLQGAVEDEHQHNEKLATLKLYIERYGHPQFAQSSIAELDTDKMARYRQIQVQILDLMKVADELASQIRSGVQEHLRKHETVGATTTNIC